MKDSVTLELIYIPSQERWNEEKPSNIWKLLKLEEVMFLQF